MARAQKMSITVGAVTLPTPVALAPMSGITDVPFRSIVRKFGDALLVSEMVASEAYVRGHREFRSKAALGSDAGPAAVQLAGHDPFWMAEAARLAESQGAPIIDLNFGCPARRVTNQLCGSALMRDLDHALRIVSAVVEAVRVPVTVKMRTGWDDASRNAPEFATRAEAAGVQLVTVHGRTRCQFYEGSADWRFVRTVKESVGIPVIVNGDIDRPEAACEARALASADGVMAGRAAVGRPWLLAQIGSALEGSPIPAAPAYDAVLDLMEEHLDRACSYHGGSLGLRMLRKHLAAYADHLGLGTAQKRALTTAETPEGARAAIRASRCMAAAA